MDIDVEMKIIHCNNPEENPIPQWLRKKEAREKECGHREELCEFPHLLPPPSHGKLAVQINNSCFY